MSDILRKMRWLVIFLLPLFFIDANAASYNMILDSSIVRQMPNTLIFLGGRDYYRFGELNDMRIDSVKENARVTICGFPNEEMKQDVTVETASGQSIQVETCDFCDSVWFYMPSELVYLSLVDRYPTYEITYDSTYINFFDGRLRPTSAKVGDTVNVMFKKGITPCAYWSNPYGDYFVDDYTITDSIFTFIMPSGPVNIRAARTTNLDVAINIECGGGEVRSEKTGDAGETIWFNVYPDPGYFTRDVFVSGAKNYEKLDDTTYRFVMIPDHTAWINVCFEKIPTYRSITTDSTFTKCNVSANPYWLQNSKGLDSIRVGSGLDFMGMFEGLNYESTLKIREKNGGLIASFKMGDSVVFFMPDSDIVLSVVNPTYEIVYDSTYIDYFTGYGYPTSAEAGTTVSVMFRRGITPKVSALRKNGGIWYVVNSSIRDSVITFQMPFADALVDVAYVLNYNSIVLDSSCARMMDGYARVYLVGEGLTNDVYDIRKQTTIDGVSSGTRVTLVGFGDPNSELKSWVKATTKSGQNIKVNTCSYCDSVWFFMPDTSVYVTMEQPYYEYYSISVDSTFSKCNVKVNPNWQKSNKGLDSMQVGELLNFTYIFNGLNYETRLYIRNTNGRMLDSFMIGDSVDFFMPAEDIVLTMKNPVYEIVYDSTYIDYFTDYGYPISAEAGSTVKILYKNGITPRVSEKYWNGDWSIMNDTRIGWESGNTWSVSFEMPFNDVKIGAAQTTDLRIYKYVSCGEGYIECRDSFANANDTVWFFVHPAVGYQVKNVFVMDGRQFHQIDDTTYMFEVVADKSPSITACFEEQKHGIYFTLSCADEAGDARMYVYDGSYVEYNFYSHRPTNGKDSMVTSVKENTRVVLEGFGAPSSELKKWVKVTTQSGQNVQTTTYEYCDSVWFFMPAEPVYISMENPFRYNSIVLDSSCARMMDEYARVYLVGEGLTSNDSYDIRKQTRIDSVTSGTRVTLTSFGGPDSEFKKWVKVTSRSGQNIKVNTCSYCDSVWFFMPDTSVYVTMEQPSYEYYSISVDSTFSKCNVTVDSYWQRSHKGLDSMQAGELLDFMDIFDGLNYESRLYIRNNSGYMLDSFMIGDSVDFFMPAEDIILTMKNPVYEIVYDSTYINYFNDYNYPISAEAGSTVKVLYKNGITPRVSEKYWNGEWLTMNDTQIEWERNNTWSVSFKMPFTDVKIEAAQTTDLRIYKSVTCGEGYIECRDTLANAHDTVWFFVHPAAGYHVASVNVSGGNQFQQFDDSTYMFEMVADKSARITACFDVDLICGCTDPAALNYDSLATLRDNSCIYETIIYGCTDPKALNYDSLATHNSGLCEYAREVGGCTDVSALNYDSLATYNDGSCQYPKEVIWGCTDTFALNYNPYAEMDNNTCEYRKVSDTIVGCKDAKAANYNPLASVDGDCVYAKEDSVVVVSGCTDPKAANYNEKATVEDGSCVYANPISTYTDATLTVNNEEVNVDSVKSIGVVETGGCEIDFTEKIDSVNVKVLSYEQNVLVTNWTVYQNGQMITYDSVSVTCTETDFVVLNLSLICNKNATRSGLRAKSTMVNAATLRSLVDLRGFSTTTKVLEEDNTLVYVYPNPATEIVHVVSPSIVGKVIYLISMDGTIVKTVKAAKEEVSIDVKNLNSGEYVLSSPECNLNRVVIVK